MKFKIMFLVAIIFSIASALTTQSKFTIPKYVLVSNSGVFYKIASTDISDKIKGPGPGDYNCNMNLDKCTVSTFEVPSHLVPTDPTNFYIHSSSVISSEVGIYVVNRQ